MLATATTAATRKITAIVMTVGSRDARLAIDPAVRGGNGGLMGGVSPGAGAQGRKDGPLGVGPMPVLSEPLGSSISDHGSAGFALCRPLGSRLLAPCCPQAFPVLGSLSTDLQRGARFGLASATFPHVILTEIGAQQAGRQEAETQETTRPESGTAPAPHVTGDTDSAPGPSARRPAGTHSLPHRISSGRIPVGGIRSIGSSHPRCRIGSLLGHGRQ